MKRVKYYYSTKTHRFEPWVLPWWKYVLRVFAWISAVLVAAGIIVALSFRYLQSPKEKRMNNQLAYLQEKYDMLRNDLKEVQTKLNDIEHRDNEVYRMIFAADPLPYQVRKGGITIDENVLNKKIAPYTNAELLEQLEKSIAGLRLRLEAQDKSFDSLLVLIQQKQDMLQSIPSIQPVSNKQLERIASGFGFRIDPIYKIGKFHAGLDFTAPTGTPIYATGDGTVELAEYSTSGYGNHIWLQHGFGYRTHYAHLVKMNVHAGQNVKRGQVIGWVGSTGKSTGPHLHYEVELKGEKIDPIHFFYNDLKPEDFERMVQIASQGNQSFD